MRGLRNGHSAYHEATAGCWLCAVTNASLHHHHVVPQAYGGTKGPMVALCSSCHNAIHHAADLNLDPLNYQLRNDAKRVWIEAKRRDLTDHENRVLARANYLINTIIKAKKIASQSNNKRTKVVLNLTAEQNRKLESLAQSRQLGKAKFLIQLIEKL